MLNQVQLCGRLVAPINLRTLADGSEVTNIRLSVSRTVKTDGSDTVFSEYIDVKLWRGMAVYAQTNFKVGDTIFVRGYLVIRPITKDGVEFKLQQVNAENVMKLT